MYKIQVNVQWMSMCTVCVVLLVCVLTQAVHLSFTYSDKCIGIWGRLGDFIFLSWKIRRQISVHCCYTSKQGPRQDSVSEEQDQDTDFYVKPTTKTKTLCLQTTDKTEHVFCVVEAPRYSHLGFDTSPDVRVTRKFNGGRRWAAVQCAEH